MKYLKTRLAFWVALMLLPVAALAQAVVATTDAPDTVVTAAGWVQLFQPFVLTIATALAGWLATRISDYLASKKVIEQDEEQRTAFQTSVKNAAGLLVQRAGRDAASAIVDLHDPRLKALHDYVQKGAPGAFARWGITPDKVSETILAALGKLLAGQGEAPVPIVDLSGVGPAMATALAEDRRNAQKRKPASPSDATGGMLRSHWLVGAAAVGMALLLAACNTGPNGEVQNPWHKELVSMTGDEAKATCIEVAGLDAVQKSSDYGIGLFVKLAYSGISCYLLPTTPGIPSEVVALPTVVPAPETAYEIAPPPEAVAVIEDEI